MDEIGAGTALIGKQCTADGAAHPAGGAIDADSKVVTAPAGVVTTTATDPVVPVVPAADTMVAITAAVINQLSSLVAEDVCLKTSLGIQSNIDF